MDVPQPQNPRSTPLARARQTLTRLTSNWKNPFADHPVEAPTGPHTVGFVQQVVLHGTRPLTLDLWYPATAHAGHPREPYSDRLLNARIARSLNLPPILGSVVPSHSFRDAPPLPGKHPVVVFNHGFASFTRQNFSNFQELASHGHLVVSIGHPGDSLLATDAQGNPVFLDTQNPVYRAVMAVQGNPRKTLQEMARVLQLQRTASSLAGHQQASRQLAHTPPFLQMRPQLDQWIDDTRFVLSLLHQPSGVLLHADADWQVLMGHSLGGLVALHFATRPTPGLRGAINLDAPVVQWEETFGLPEVPLLSMPSTQYRLQGHDLSMAGTLNLWLQHSHKGAHLVEVQDTAHHNFTDMNHMQAMRFTPQLGKTDGLHMAKLLNQTLLNFLRQLQNPDTFGQPLLQDPTARTVFFEGKSKHD